MEIHEYRGLMDVAREVAVPYYRILYAENAGRLPAPMRVANKRVYTEADIARIRDYFDSKENHEQDQNALRQVQRSRS
jgi:hypothetical protein